MTVPSLGWAAIDWIETFLVHGPGDIQGQPIELDDEFAAFIVKAYALDPKNGDRLIRRAFLSRAKGRAKSELAGWIAVFEALGPCRFDHWAEAGEVSDWGYEYDEGEPVGAPLSYVEIINVATEENQAGNTYDVIYYVMDPETCSPAFLERFGRLDVGLTRINLPNRRGYLEPNTSADTSKDGKKSTFIVADETHLWILARLHRLHAVMVRNLLKRKKASGWMLETSTMYAEGEGSVAEGTHAYAESSARTKKFLLFDHRQASDHWDLTKRSERIKALRESYGPAAAWMNLGAIADAWDDPQVSEGEWRRFWLNQPVPLVEAPPGIMPNWAVLSDGQEQLEQLAIGVALDTDREWYSIGSVTIGENGLPFLCGELRTRSPVEVVEHAAWLQQVTGCRVVVDKKGPASSLIPDLEAADVDVEDFGLEQYIEACSLLYDAVEKDLSLRHDSGSDLNAAVQAAGWRRVGDRQVWARRNGDISMLEAVTLALWCLINELNYDVLESIY